MDRPVSVLPRVDLKLTTKQLLRIAIANQRDIALLLSMLNINSYSREEAQLMASNLTDLLQGIPK